MARFMTGEENGVPMPRLFGIFGARAREVISRDNAVSRAAPVAAAVAEFLLAAFLDEILVFCYRPGKMACVVS